MNSIDILEELIAFPTVSRDSNLDLILYVESLLAPLGIACTRIPNRDGQKASLLASVGPADRAGILISGHTDVVPADGQNWTTPPFELSRNDGRLFGRGAADMKGFVASAIATMIHAAKMELEIPLHLALSYDEEIGCVGARDLIHHVETTLPRPLLCIVGEPSGMITTTGHKGKWAARASCRGREGHSAMAPLALNAIHLGCDLITAIRAEQDHLEKYGARDDQYEVPYSTLHVGTIAAGTALNIVPNHCTLDFELRYVPGDDPEAIFARLFAAARKIEQRAKQIAQEAAITIEIVNAYPGLDTPTTSPVVELLASLTGNSARQKVAFGTEGGLFQQALDIPTAICGPGFMAQGHKPDEFLAIDQLHACDNMLHKLVALAARPAGSLLESIIQH